MKKRMIALVVALGPACLPAVAQVLPQPPDIAASSYLLLDITANQILAAKNIDMPVEPASLTKLMTAYLVFDALGAKKIAIDQTLPVSERAWRQRGSRMFIDTKMKVPVEDLIKGMMVQSGNDATMALAEGVSGTAERFVQIMNDQARALGMTSTTFTNPQGLSEEGHATTVRDLSVLAARLLNDFPQHRHFYAIRKYRYQDSPADNDSNRNLLLFRDPTVDGLKTGYTKAAGYCLIATASRNFPNLGPPGTPGADGPRRLMAFVLGATSENARANEAQKLLNWGYTAFEAVKLFEANQAVVSPAVWKGQSALVLLGRPQAIVVAVPTGSAASIVTHVVRAEPLVAPLNKGQARGQLKVTQGERPLVNVPLLVLETVEEAGLLGRAWDTLRLWLR